MWPISSFYSDRQGNPYIENHHIIWLSQGNKDSINNTVALCTNCHCKMHVVNSADDIQKLLQAVKVIAVYKNYKINDKHSEYGGE